MSSVTAAGSAPANRKTLLLIALDFPPCQSAGAQRMRKFATHLKDFGWDVVVLTARPAVYERCDPQADLPQVLHIERCFALDSSRDLSWRGKYAGFLAVPDKYWSWAIQAIPAGKRLIKRFKPDAILSTYPVSTAHFIAYRLQAWSGLPWVADYRDPLQCRYDPGVLRYSALGKWIEQKTITHCSQAVFTTENAARLYARLYPHQPLSRFRVIENGYDEENFQGLSANRPVDEQRFVLLHSGALYGDGRDPSLLFAVLSELKASGRISAETFSLRFRGVQPSADTQQRLAQWSIEDLVTFLPPVPYRDSLAEMFWADALLLLQGPLFNNQIPSKVYDYMRTGRRILALTPDQGSTALTLRQYPRGHCVQDAARLGELLVEWLEHPPGESDAATALDVAPYSRYERARQLSELLQATQTA